MREVELHVTDVQQFNQCRLRWSWASALRRNLQPAGTPPALFLGQGVHKALDAYYSQPIQLRTMDVPTIMFKDWCKARAAKIEAFTGKLWQQERDMINEMHALGRVMLLHYGMWAQQYDKDFEVVATEQKFKFDVPSFDDADANSKLPEDVKLTVAGRFDGVVQDNKGDKYLLEFKTAGRMDNARWTMRSLQTSLYAWAASQSYGSIKGVVYRFLLKKSPEELQWLPKSGRFSTNKNQKTSAEWASAQIREAGYNPKDYADFLLNLNGDGNPFFTQYIVVRTPTQMQDAIRATYEYGKLMSNTSTAVFAHGGFHCSYCPFVDPCTLRERGMDYEALLEAEYESRDYWEEDENEN